MRAIIVHAAHDLRIGAVAIGTPGPCEVVVRIETGGICGSDLHYVREGRIGTITLREPMVLGHEVAGRIESLGSSVVDLAVGDRVALNPSRPCGQCRFCRLGHQIHCLDMRFYGSAMRFPHVQGAFRERIVADAAQCHVVPPTLSPGEAAMAEPLAVCLHAVNRAGAMLGKRVLVTGSGPIGALCVIAARRAGAAEIVATDLSDAPGTVMRQVGADRFINVARDAPALAAYAPEKGQFDVMLEASGSDKALAGALDVVRPQGIIVQIGIGGVGSLPLNVIVAKEIDLRGSFRFQDEFGLAVTLIAKRLVDVRPLISATLPFTDAHAAFELAADRQRAMKVQLSFT